MDTSGSNLKIGLRGKTLLGLGFLVFCALLILGGTTYWHSFKVAEKTAVEFAGEEIEQLTVGVGYLLKSSRADLKVIKSTPPIQGIIRAMDDDGFDVVGESTIDEWRGRLATIFDSFMRNNPGYSQLRYLDKDGNEIVRVELLGMAARIVPREELQNKADYPYFTEAIKLESGEFYSSDVTLNRERGPIETPHTPMLRLSTPIYDEVDVVSGVLVLNILADPIFDTIIPKTGIETYIIDDKGYFLRHPDSAKEFGGELGHGFSVSDIDYELDDDGSFDRHDKFVYHQPHENHIEGFKKVFFDPSDRTRYWNLLYKIPNEMVFASLYATRNSMLATGIPLGILSIILITLLVSRRVVRPVVSLSEAARKMRAGDLSIRVPEEEVTDEFRHLYRAVNEFAEAQQCAVERFERALTVRTEELQRSNIELLGSQSKLAARSGELENLNRALISSQSELDARNNELKTKAEYEGTMTRLIALFNSSFNEEYELKEMFSILGERLPLPCAAFYRYDEWSGKAVCVASKGNPECFVRAFSEDESHVNRVCVDLRPVVLEGDEIDFTCEAEGCEAGGAAIKPLAVFIHPVTYREKVLGALVIASTAQMDDLKKDFIEKLSIHLGIELNNLKQYADLKELSAQLKQKGKEIGQKNIQLEESNKMKSEFLANMSHELRTPLNAIIGFSEILKDGLMGEMADKQKDYCNDIFTSGQHLLSLINDILDLSKIEAGKMTLDLEGVSVPGLLKNSLMIVKEKAMSHSIGLELDLDERLGIASVDPRKLKQVVYNLLSNAVKFTHDHGTVSLAASLVEKDSGRMMEISVTDTGIGISEKNQKRLFKPFEQLEGAITKKYKGTGLGLMLVKRLTELHGGTVEVRSKKGEGSSFTVRIPYMADEGATAEESLFLPEKPLQEMSSEKGPLVLIVEDDAKAADITKAQLEERGYRTMTSETAEDGLKAAALMRPDLIVLDILLPSMSGWDFLQMIKDDDATCNIPVVIHSIVADSRKGFSLGASAVLHKPVERRELFETLERLGFDDRAGELKVLVIDDDPQSVEFVSRNLEEAGYKVRRAYGGEEGIEAAMEDSPDLLVLDLIMPEVSGFDVVSALRSNRPTSVIPVIILTAKVLTDEDRDILSGNVFDIVEKWDYRAEDFVREVDCALGRRTVGCDVCPDPPMGPVKESAPSADDSLKPK